MAPYSYIVKQKNSTVRRDTIALNAMHVPKLITRGIEKWNRKEDKD